MSFWNKAYTLVAQHLLLWTSKPFIDGLRGLPRTPSSLSHHLYLPLTFCYFLLKCISKCAIKPKGPLIRRWKGRVPHSPALNHNNYNDNTNVHLPHSKVLLTVRRIRALSNDSRYALLLSACHCEGWNWEHPHLHVCLNRGLGCHSGLAGLELEEFKSSGIQMHLFLAKKDLKIWYPKWMNEWLYKMNQA